VGVNLKLEPFLDAQLSSPQCLSSPNPPLTPLTEYYVPRVLNPFIRDPTTLSTSQALYLTSARRWSLLNASGRLNPHFPIRKHQLSRESLPYIHKKEPTFPVSRFLSFHRIILSSPTITTAKLRRILSYPRHHWQYRHQALGTFSIWELSKYFLFGLVEGPSFGLLTIPQQHQLS
jgi:hypothetical protein